jgi:mono/diheme cytochrome c family protein
LFRSIEYRGVRVASALATLASAATLGVWALQFAKPEPAQAIPMFALRTGASCDLCHTTFPGMTNYGMMVMMSNLSMLPHDAAHNPGFTSLVFSEQFTSAPDSGVPKLHTDNLGFLSGGFVGKDFTYYLEQHVIDGGFTGGTDQFWMAYNNLFGGTGALQFGKFHTPFPFMPAHRITIAPYLTTHNTVGENGFNEDDSHWGVTLSNMQGTLMYGLSVLGGNDLIGKGAFALAGDHDHSIDFSLMTMSDQPLNYGIGLIRGYAPLAEGGFDPFNREAVYLQYRPNGFQRLQIQAVGQLGYDANPTATGVGTNTRGGFLEAQYELAHKNFMVLRWDTQNGDSPEAGATLDLIHQFAPNMKFTLEGRKLTTGTSMGFGIEWAGPWSRSRVLATPHLGSMAGMNMGSMNMGSMNMNRNGHMAGMNMGGTDGMSPLAHTLAHGDATRGAQAFTIHSCVQCHGAGGTGGGIGPRLVGAASALTPEQIYDYIKHPRAPMPDFKLSDDEIADLVAYVDSLTPGHTVAADIEKEYPSGGMAGGMAGMPMNAPPPVYSIDQAPVNSGTHGYFPGVETGNATSGAALFSANCTSCHGAGGAGGKASALVGLAKVDSPSYFAWQIKDHSPSLQPLTLSDKKIADLAAYLELLGTHVAPAGAPLQTHP